MDPVLAYSEFSVATDMRWLIDDYDIDQAGYMEIRGWIASLIDDFAPIKILFNGEPAEKFNLMAAPDVGAFYPNLGADCFRRFVAGCNLKALTLENGLVSLSVVDSSGLHCRTYRSSWFCPDTVPAFPVPEPDQIERVIGASGSSKQYLFGGATLARRFDLYLQERFGIRIADFGRVLDWGCGCGRLTRYLLALNEQTYGADIDAANVAWCNENLRHLHFQHLALSPPSPFSDKEFNLVTGVSVFTHLSEQDQFRWLEELARITNPGGILLISVHGPASLAYARLSAEVGKQVWRDGFVLLGNNPSLRDHIQDESYYKDILHSHDYIYAHWSRFLEIVEIVPTLAHHQDVVVMRKRLPEARPSARRR
jgi:SAM-dependent methyltransferase